jgi:hypothetical protein
LTIEPRLVSLGSFSAQNPGSNQLNPGTTTVRISSANPWSLYVTLVQPPRRLSDNLELPLERVQQLFPDLSQLCGYIPVRLDYGPGESDEQVISYDWQVAQSRIAEYLDEADPPGIYCFTVRVELQARDSTSMGSGILLVTEFTVQPRVEIELISSDWVVPVEHPGEPAESEPMYLRVRSNCAWALEMIWGGDLYTRGGFRLERDRLTWRVEPGQDWQSMAPDYVPFRSGAVVAAHGSAPPAFTLAEVEIPFQLRVATDRVTVAGNYLQDIKFRLHADNPASK